MRRAIIRELKKKLRRKGLRKFELVDGSSRAGRLGGAPGGVGGVITRFGVLKGGSS